MGAYSKDRIAGALLGLAAGDALGAGYEFTTPGPDEPIIYRTGSMGFAPGEWTDDTAQAVGIASVTAKGSTDPVAIGQRFLDWFADGPRDVGISTRAVLAGAQRDPARLEESAARYFARHPRGAAGNGSLMRTAPVALAHLGDDAAIAALARTVSALTHGDPLAAEGCVIWCLAIDHAIATGVPDVRAGITRAAALGGADGLDAERSAFWSERMDEAEAGPPARFGSGNGFVVTAAQAAWSAIHHTPEPTEQPARRFADALVNAVRIGQDTDTVAAIAGMLLGAAYGASAVPWRWRRMLHGWGADGADDLVRLALLTASGGTSDNVGWPQADSLVPDALSTEKVPVCAPDPDDDDLLLGNLPGIVEATEERGADAVVSLCRVGTAEVGPEVEHHRFWLIDQPGRAANPNLAFVLDDAVKAVQTLRAEGRRVFLHCHGGRSRTGMVAAALRSDAHGESPDEAVAILRGPLPEIRPNPTFMAALHDRAAR